MRIYVSPIRVCDVDMFTVLWLRCSSDAIDLKDAIVLFAYNEQWLIVAYCGTLDSVVGYELKPRGSNIAAFKQNEHSRMQELIY